MLFNYDDETDNFDDEPQDLPLNEEGEADFHSDFPEDEEPREAASEMGEEQDEESNESAAYARIAEILGEDEVEEVPPPLMPVNPTGTLFRHYEQNHTAYTDAMTAYFEEKNYQQAIEKFDAAIADASERIEHDLTQAQVDEIVAKSMYWQAEAYVKTQNLSQAVETFNALIQNCKGHYLTLAAERRKQKS